MIQFNHSGGIGDILYSLYFCKDLIEAGNQTQFNFHIQTNVVDHNMEAQVHPFGNVRMTNDGAEFLKPLLESQEYINEVTISDDCPNDAINLDNFRKIPINFAAGDIRNWYYNLASNHLKREFWKPIIDVKPNLKYKNKILFCLTTRYCNIHIDYNKLKEFSDNLIFIGTKSEYEEFERKYFKLEYAESTDLKDIAEKLKGAKGFLGNQSGIYTLAECMKINRILMGPEMFVYNNKIFPGPHNNHPIGGWCEDVSTTNKLVASVKELLKCK